MVIVLMIIYLSSSRPFHHCSDRDLNLESASQAQLSATISCPVHTQSQETSMLVRIVRILKHNPLYPCKYFIWTNVFLLMYFMVITNKYGIRNYSEVHQQKSNSSSYKFEQFQVESWNSSQTFQLKTSTEELFV